MYEEIQLLDGCEKVTTLVMSIFLSLYPLQLDEYENITIASGKRKNRTCDSKIAKAPKGKKKKKIINDEGIR